MIFSKITTTNSNYNNNNIIQPRQTVTAPTIRFGMTVIQPIKKNVENVPVNRIESTIEDVSINGTGKKMKWGEPTWFLFHTLAEKVKEEHFLNVRSELIDVITTVCMNLPCPDCAGHATKYMKGVDFNTIRTKQDLKDMLFSFHNTVNKRKGYDQFAYEDLTSKYSTAVTKNIIYNFMTYFQDKHFSIRMIADDFHRARLVSKLKVWFNENVKYFDP